MALSQDMAMFSCGLCQGVFTSDQERDLHKANCDGSVRNSSALFFVCERKFYLKICADINKPSPYEESNNVSPAAKRGRPRKIQSQSQMVKNSKPNNHESKITPQKKPGPTASSLGGTITENITSSEHNYHITNAPIDEDTGQQSENNEQLDSAYQRRSGRKRKRILREDFIDESELKTVKDTIKVTVKEEGEISYLEDDEQEDEDYVVQEAQHADEKVVPADEEVVDPAQAFNFSNPEEKARKSAHKLYCRYQRYIKPSTYDGPPESAIFMCPDCPAQISPVESFVVHLKACKPINRSKEWRQACEEKYKHMAMEITNSMGTKRTVYKCNICQKVSRAAGLMYRHMSTTHALEWKCEKCNLTFPTRQKYSRHIDKHVKPHMCEFCSERFSQKKDMVRHTWTHTGVFPLNCDECDYKCRHARALKEHKRCHTGYLRKCKEPGCTFVTQWDAAYTAHMAAKHEEKNRYICQECSYRTNTKGCYDKHLLTHLGLKKFKCSLCAYKAVQKSDIVKHLRKKHMKQQSYFCDRCPFSSGYSHGFRIHMMQHMGIKPWQCSLCGYNSVTKQKLVRHISNRHPDREGKCINLGLKLDLKYSQYLRPNQDTDKQDNLFVEEEHGTVRLLMRDDYDGGESETVIENEDVQENIIYEAADDESKSENQVVYIISEIVDEGQVEIVSSEDVNPAEGATPAPHTEVMESAFQIQTEDGTVLHIPDISSIPELSQVVSKTGTKTIFIKPKSLVNKDPHEEGPSEETNDNC